MPWYSLHQGRTHPEQQEEDVLGLVGVEKLVQFEGMGGVGLVQVVQLAQLHHILLEEKQLPQQ